MKNTVRKVDEVVRLYFKGVPLEESLKIVSKDKQDEVVQCLKKIILK